MKNLNKAAMDTAEFGYKTGKGSEHSMPTLDRVKSRAAETAGSAPAKTEDYLDSLLETSPDGIGIVDEHGRLVRWNRAAADLFEYDFSELGEKSVFDLYADKRELNRMLSELRREGRIRKYAIGMKKKSGATGIFEISVSLLKDDRERVTGSVCVARDTGGERTAAADAPARTGGCPERERAEQILRDSRERLRLALEAGKAGTWDRDLASGKSSWDGYTHRLFGLKPGFAPRKYEDFLEMIHPDDRERVGKEIEAAFNGTGDYSTSYRVIWPDSSVHFIADRGKFFRDDTGRATRMTGVSWDFTELRLAQEALSASEERLRLALEATEEGIWDYNLLTGVTVLSPRWYTMLGYEPYELPQGYDTWSTLLHPEDAVRARKAIEEHMARQEGCAVEVRMRTKSGDWKWILMRGAVVVRNEDGTPVRMVGTHTDITEHKKSEQALRDSEERLNLALAASQMGAWEWDVSSGAVFWCQECYRIFGAQSFGGDFESFLQIVHPDDRACVRERIALALKRNGVYGHEYRIVRPDGEVRWISGLGRAECGPNGEPLRVRGITRDITEQKQLEKERDRTEARLAQSHKLEALGTLAGGVAHEFNNILAIIMGYTEISMMEIDEGKPIGENLREVFQACRRAKELVRQILSFCRRSEQAKMPLQIGLIVKEAMKMLRSSLPSNIEIKTDIQSNAFALADPPGLQQVLVNLSTNAVHAMPDGGVLEVTLADFRIEPETDRTHFDLRPGPYLKLTVADTGQGIPPAIMDRIFDPFFTTREIGKGSGLGLSVVHGIVEDHGGAIRAESSSKGAVFTVLLPVESTSASSAVESSCTAHRGKERILVIDDEPALCHMLKQMLANLGYTVDYRTSAIDALKLFNRRRTANPFDLVITDMTMPQLTGIDLARKLHEQEPDLPVVLLTGFNREIDTETAEALGFQGFLMKPVFLEELAELVRKTLSGRKGLCGESTAKTTVR